MAAKLMHAVQYDSYGGPAELKHVEVQIPSPKKDEVLIKVEVASINPYDWKIQKGIGRPFLPCKLPFIPGSDIAGEVSAVGDGVKTFKEGDKVVAMLYALKGGGLAEYAIAPASSTVKRPPEISAAEASGLCMAGLTALQTLKRIGTRFDGSDSPANILVTAASGGVGHYAIQLAKAVNNHVTATCGARNIELMKNLGADEVLDYKTPEGASLKSPSGKKYDGVVHCATGISWSTFAPNLSGNGKVVDITPTPGVMFTSVLKKLTFSKKQLVPFFASVNGEDLEFMVRLYKEGKIRTVIDSKYPLSRAEEAWAKGIEGHATGKIIVEMITDES